MKSSFKIIILVSVSFALIGTNSVFAQSTYTINIPTGAASPDAPYFWQSEKDGDPDGNIQVVVGDTVRWSNADTAAHTVTSGISPDLGGSGSDGMFDSGLFAPGKSFEFTFKEEGKFPYYCIVHPWMTGVVTVETALSVLPNVGADAGDGTTTFDVEYDYNRLVADATVDEEQNAITFTLVGNAKSDDNTLTLYLHKGLISNPNVIWVDGKSITDFEVVSEGGFNIVTIPLSETAERLTILGSSVVPEFGTLTAVVLAIAMVAVIFTMKKSKIIPKIH